MFELILTDFLALFGKGALVGAAKNFVGLGAAKYFGGEAMWVMGVVKHNQH